MYGKAEILPERKWKSLTGYVIADKILTEENKRILPEVQGKNCIGAGFFMPDAGRF